MAKANHDPRELFNAINDVYHQAVQFGHSHNEIMATIARRRESKTWKRASVYARTQAKGYESCWFDRLFRDFLSYVNVGPDGRQFKLGDDSWLTESTEYKNAFKGYHAWPNGNRFSEPK